jgi:hypothetical protein
VRGNRLGDDGKINHAAKSGRGLVFDGYKLHDTYVRIEMDNVHVAQAMDQGIEFVGSIYGGSIRNCFVSRCGKTALRAVNSEIGIGEMWLARMRLFQNGGNGKTEQEQAGFEWRAGTVHISQMSSSENRGPGAILGGGPFTIGTLQMESNGLSVPQAERRQLVIGQPGAGVLSCRITNLVTSPGPDYGGAHLYLSSNAHNVKVDGGYMGDTLSSTGRHIERERESSGLDYSGLATALGKLVIIDRASSFDTRHNVLLLARLQAPVRNVTGDGMRAVWRPEAVVVDTRAIYDGKTGTITAPVAGAYRIDVMIGLENISAAHDDARLYYTCPNAPRIEEHGHPGVVRSGAGRFSMKSSQVMLLGQGDRCQIAFSIGGAARTIGLIGGGLHGMLSLSTAN